MAEIYQGRLHDYSPLRHPPVNPYQQYNGIFRFLRHELERRSAEHYKTSEAELKKESIEQMKERHLEELERKKRDIEREEERLET